MIQATMTGTFTILAGSIGFLLGIHLGKRWNSQQRSLPGELTIALNTKDLANELLF